MARHDHELKIFPKSRREEWKSVDVIPVGVSQEQNGPINAFSHMPVPKLANAGTGIQYDMLVPDLDLHTARIAAVFQMTWSGASNATSRTPERDGETHDITPYGKTLF
jgi:hypothetical protein